VQDVQEVQDAQDAQDVSRRDGQGPASPCADQLVGWLGYLSQPAKRHHYRSP